MDDSPNSRAPPPPNLPAIQYIYSGMHTYTSFHMVPYKGCVMIITYLHVMYGMKNSKIRYDIHSLPIGYHDLENLIIHIVTFNKQLD